MALINGAAIADTSRETLAAQIFAEICLGGDTLADMTLPGLVAWAKAAESRGYKAGALADADNIPSGEAAMLGGFALTKGLGLANMARIQGGALADGAARGMHCELRAQGINPASVAAALDDVDGLTRVAKGIGIFDASQHPEPARVIIKDKGADGTSVLFYALYDK